MKNIVLRNKILSGLLSVLMVVSFFFSWPVSASAATAEEHTQSGNLISNEYLKAAVNNNNRLALYTTGGNPDSARDNNARLLFGDISSGTSDAILRVGSNTVAIGGTPRVTPDGKSLYSSYDYNGVRVERFISFSYNTYTGREDTVEYKYVLTNISDTEKSAGVRIFFDTMLGDNDHAPFRVGGRNVTTFTEFTGASIPRVWQVFQSYTSPTVVASGTFYNTEEERPDKVQFLSYGSGSHDGWECTGSGSIGDSAVNIYFNPKTLAPGESRVVKTYYGLSEFIPDPDIPDEPVGPTPVANLSINAFAPRELLKNAEGTEYLGNPFTLNGDIVNSGNAAATNVVATLNLPEGLSASDTTVNLGNIAAGGSASIYWNITAAPTAYDTTYEYSVTYYGDGIEPRSVTYTIFVPALLHYHSYTETGSIPATCTTPGYIYYSCYCGDTAASYERALGHNYQSIVIQQATCTEPGIIDHRCIRCEDSYLTYVYAEHVFEVIEYQPATCVANGYYTYACSSCDYTYYEVIPGGHDYHAVVTRVATHDSDGEITYTCSICGDFYIEIIPARPEANVLLVQDRLPWTENINTALLDRLVADGYITGWDMVTTAAFGDVNLASYNVIYIANDQSTATYNQLAAFNTRITEFANAGGVVVYGACDHGWAGGNISYQLPGGVSKGNYYSYRNYIANFTHNIVTGVLTDGKSLTNDLLYSTYSSHTYFTNLPEGAVVILEDANGRPTLVEYPVGDGYVIASGLTWEYTYVRNFINGTSFAKSVYDDLLVYAVMMSDLCEHVFDEGIIVDPLCEEDGYTLHTCEICGVTMKDTFTPALGHIAGEWETITVAGPGVSGLEVVRCTRSGCETILDRRETPPIDVPVAKVEANVNEVIYGQTIDFYITISQCDPIKAMAVVPIFDTNVFSMVSAEWLVDGNLSYIEEGTYRSVIAWANPVDANTAVYKFTLRAISLTAASEVSATVMYQIANDVEDFLVIGDTVAVISCPHASFTNVQANTEFHASICDVCGYNELRAHSFDNGCDTDCNDNCGYVRTIEHIPGEFVFDADNHWKICAECGSTLDFAVHNPGDAATCVNPQTCVDCGCELAPALGHDFATEWSSDAEGHWYACSRCDAIDAYAAHMPGAPATCVDPQICVDCGYVVAPALGHTYYEFWSSDADAHWHECYCGDRIDIASHVYDNGCDTDCNICGEVREITHTPDTVYDVNANEHWLFCTVCGIEVERGAHEYDGDSDAHCNTCGYCRVVRGDVNGDGRVTSDDAILLLNYSYFQTMYSINQNGDMNGDGRVTSDDAILLLNYSYFPAMYTLVYPADHFDHEYRVH